MTNFIQTIFQYGFLQHAIIAGVLTAISCAILGVFLVSRKMSLIGDGLSHSLLGAIALGMFLGINPYYVVIPFAVVVSLYVAKASEKVQSSSLIGIVSAGGLSIGIILISLAQGFNSSLLSYLFGNILTVSLFEVYLSAIVFFVTVIMVTLLYRELFSLSFDSEYAKTVGIKSNFIDLFFFTLTALVVVLAVKIGGIVLASSFIILPASTAIRLSSNFKKTILAAIVIALVAVIIGIYVSFITNLPTGPTIVLINLIVFILSGIIKHGR